MSPEAFEKTLGIFAHMFTDVTYSKEHVMKEVEAVNSEYLNSKVNDNWKNQYLLGVLAREGHSARKFSCGSIATLISNDFDILIELEKYEKTHYSSPLMALVVASSHSIE